MLEFLGFYSENLEVIKTSSLLEVPRPALVSDLNDFVLLKKSNIPFQVSLDSLNYFKLQQKLAPKLEGGISFCAKFVNNFFYIKNGVFLYGDAWTIQQNIKNNQYLNLLWKTRENYDLKEFNKYNKKLRQKNFIELYKKLDTEFYPEGIIGFLYHFSNYKESLKKSQFKQTHITYCSGRKNFRIKNKTQQNLKVSDILNLTYGSILASDKLFLKQRGIKLNQVIKPQESYIYTDYLIEEQFRKLTHRSLLEIFLQKQRNDKVSWLLAPVSYSQISLNLIQEKRNQQNIFDSIGGVIWVTPKNYEEFWKVNSFQKNNWDNFLNKYFQKYYIINSPLKPIPQNFARFLKL